MFRLKFLIRNAGGIQEVMAARSVNLLECEGVVNFFYEKRAAIYRRCCSSQYLFGGNFKPGTWEWLICHSVIIRIEDESGSVINEYKVTHPYLETINKSRE